VVDTFLVTGCYNVIITVERLTNTCKLLTVTVCSFCQVLSRDEVVFEFVIVAGWSDDEFDDDDGEVSTCKVIVQFVNTIHVSLYAEATFHFCEINTDGSPIDFHTVN
jgi:hypothetical protein